MPCDVIPSAIHALSHRDICPFAGRKGMYKKAKEALLQSGLSCNVSMRIFPDILARNILLATKMLSIMQKAMKQRGY